MRKGFFIKIPTKLLKSAFETARGMPFYPALSLCLRLCRSALCPQPSSSALCHLCHSSFVICHLSLRPSVIGYFGPLSGLNTTCRTDGQPAQRPSPAHP